MRVLTLTLLVASATIASGLAPSAPSPAETDISLDEFEHQFGQFTPDKELEKEWAENLEKHEAEIDAQNEKYMNGESTFFEELNAFSQLSDTDFKREKTGVIRDEGRKFATGLLRNDPEKAKLISEANEAFFARYRLSRGSVPASVNSVNANKVTPVKNQGRCGSCSAFSAASLLETCMLIGGDSVDKAKLDLSEQDLMDCAYDNKDAFACDGAYVQAYQQWIVERNGGGLSHENARPYTAARKTCAKNAAYNSGAKAKYAKYTANCDEETMMNLVAQFGSVSTTVATTGAIMNYGGGIIDGCRAAQQNQQDHAVTVVGYGTENNVPYWLVKNSWGTYWGENGYFRIKRGAKMCGIAAECVILDCSASKGTTAEPPPASTTKSPEEAAEAGTACDLSFWAAHFGVFDGSYQIDFYDGFPATIKCVNNQCVPAYPVDMSACEYICGNDRCAFDRSAKVEQL